MRVHIEDKFMKKHFIFIISLLFIGNSLLSQENNIISLKDFSSTDIVFKDSKANLFQTLGLPDKEFSNILYVVDTITCSKFRYIDSKKNITVYYYYKHGLVYYSMGGDSLQIVSIDLKKNKNNKIYFKNIALSNKVTMQNFIDSFNLVEYEDYENIIHENFDPIYHKSQKNFFINFATHKPAVFSIKFLFDKNKNLEYIDFGYNNGNIIPILIGDCGG